MELFLLSAILLVVIVLYITNWLPIEITSLLILPALFFTGILDLRATFSGFSSSATITIAAMFVLSAGLSRTGVLAFVTLALGRYARGSRVRLLILLACVIPLASAFMNNTPVVVMMVPIVLGIAREFDIKPSKLMIPLSYFAILGGTCTLIGTSTNILVHEIYMDAGGPGFRMFEFLPLGAIFVVVGAVYLLVFGQRLLPEKGGLSAVLPRGRTAKFVTEIVIERDSALEGKSVADVFQSDKVRLLEIVRKEEVILAPHAQHIVLEGDDALIIEGASQDIAEFLTKSGASLSSIIEDAERVPMRTLELMLAEAVVLPQSPFIGRRVSDLSLNRHYGVKVLAVQRRGRHHRYKIRQMYLQQGDVMLLQAGKEGFSALHESEAVLLVEGLEKAIFHKRHSIIAVGIMALVIILASVTSIPISILAVSGAALMIVTRCLRPDEAFRSLDASVLLLLAGTIPLGIAMQQTSMAEGIVGFTMQLSESFPLAFKVGAFYLATSLITEFLSNNATAVLMTPIAIGTAAKLGVDPKPFLAAIAFGASACFMGPLGYQTNAIVMGPGGYRFRDYLKIGIPLNLLLWILAMIFIPTIWPFYP